MPRRYRRPKRAKTPPKVSKAKAAPVRPPMPEYPRQSDYRRRYETSDLTDRIATIPRIDGVATMLSSNKTTTGILALALVLAAGGVGLIAGIVGWEAAAQVGRVRQQAGESGLFLNGGALFWVAAAAVVGLIAVGAGGYSVGHQDTAAALHKARREIGEWRESATRWHAEVQAALKERIALVASEQAEAERRDEAFRTSYVAGRKWLAGAVADVWIERESIREFVLRNKPHAGVASADVLKESRAEKRGLAVENRWLRMQIASYEEYFPELLDYRELILAEAVDFTGGESIDDIDPVRLFVSDEEYNAMSVTERNQRALDRYKQRHKSDWEIGRQYERQIGWEHEAAGWRVSYEGALKGLADFGRDLLARRDGECRVIQCKNWSALKVIREKHIFQLFGTTVLFRLAEGLPKDAVTPMFYTTTQLSPEAEMVAKELAVEIRRAPLVDYPMVKCNVTASGERIYHLPFDQMYDRTVIGNMPGECYTATVKDAEELGFRRAYRWRPEAQLPGGGA